MKSVALDTPERGDNTGLEPEGRTSLAEEFGLGLIGTTALVPSKFKRQPSAPPNANTGPD